MLKWPARELSILLQTKVMLEAPNIDNDIKHDGNKFKQFNIVSNSKNQFLLNIGPALDEYNFSLTQDEAFKALSEVIQNCGDRLKFNILRLPIPRNSGLEHCAVDLHENVIIRIIDYYEIRIDEILTRYDVLIEKVIKNA